MFCSATLVKRQNNLLQAIVAYDNLRLAWLKAIKGKRRKTCVLLYSKNLQPNLEKIRSRLLSSNPDWGNYHYFSIHEPKPRIISAASFEERIMHHAIMNILDPLFERRQIYHSYACRKGKGTHAAIRFAFQKTKAYSWFLKLDIQKYFDSIDHAVLKAQLATMIKDQPVLQLLFGLIDSYATEQGRGIPIGNLTSQYFANLYLSGLDHFILEQLKPAAYMRYMDDFVLWSTEKKHLQFCLDSIRTYCQTNLGLTLKPEILGKSKHGLPFLGFLIKSGGIFLLRKSKRRMRKRAKQIQTAYVRDEISQDQLARRAISVNAAVLLSRSRSFRAILWNGSSFRVEPQDTGRQLEQQRV